MIDDNEKALIKRMRLLEKDHEPDGFPCIPMMEITKLLDILDREQAIMAEKKLTIRQIRSQMANIKDTVRVTFL